MPKFTCAEFADKYKKLTVVAGEYKKLAERGRTDKTIRKEAFAKMKAVDEALRTLRFFVNERFFRRFDPAWPKAFNAHEEYTESVRVPLESMKTEENLANFRVLDDCILCETAQIFSDKAARRITKFKPRLVVYPKDGGSGKEIFSKLGTLFSINWGGEKTVAVIEHNEGISFVFRLPNQKFIIQTENIGVVGEVKFISDSKVVVNDAVKRTITIWEKTGDAKMKKSQEIKFPYHQQENISVLPDETIVVEKENEEVVLIAPDEQGIYSEKKADVIKFGSGHGFLIDFLASAGGTFRATFEDSTCYFIRKAGEQGSIQSKWTPICNGRYEKSEPFLIESGGEKFDVDTVLPSGRILAITNKGEIGQSKGPSLIGNFTENGEFVVQFRTPFLCQAVVETDSRQVFLQSGRSLYLLEKDESGKLQEKVPFGGGGNFQIMPDGQVYLQQSDGSALFRFK